VRFTRSGFTTSVKVHRRGETQEIRTCRLIKSSSCGRRLPLFRDPTLTRSRQTRRHEGGHVSRLSRDAGEKDVDVAPALRPRRCARGWIGSEPKPTVPFSMIFLRCEMDASIPGLRELNLFDGINVLFRFNEFVYVVECATINRFAPCFAAGRFGKLLAAFFVCSERNRLAKTRTFNFAHALLELENGSREVCGFPP